MMRDLLETYPEEAPQWPTSETYRGLVKAAIRKNDVDAAETFIKNAKLFLVSPNANVFSALMEWRLQADDLMGAVGYYRQSLGSLANTDEDIPVLNQLLRVLAAVEKPDFELITRITEDLEKRGSTLESEDRPSPLNPLPNPRTDHGRRGYPQRQRLSA